MSLTTTLNAEQAYAFIQCPYKFLDRQWGIALSSLVNSKQIFFCGTSENVTL